MKKQIQFALILTGLLYVAACQDELPDSSGEQAEEQDASALQLEGSDGYVDIAGSAHTVQVVEVLEGDFVMDAGEGKLYYEENDGTAPRSAQVHVTYADGTDSLFHFVQSVASRATQSSMTQFYRHYGIGYSYNAVSGNYCNLRDFRCQVLNRAVIEKIEKEQSIDLLRVNKINQTSSKRSSYSSVVEYIQNTNFKADVKAKLIVYAGEASGTCWVFEDGVVDTYILHDELTSNRAEYSIGYADLLTFADKYPTLLTSSFRLALSKIDATNKSIDDFINLYGTHVVVYSNVGASMAVDIQVETKKFTTLTDKELLTEQALATLFHEVQSKSEEERYEQMLKDSKCQFTVKGGDVSYFDNLVGVSNFDNTSFTTSMKNDWLNSIKFDDSNISKSNVELVDMEVVPIWYFIPDEQLADRVEARVTGNMSLVVETLGNDNFINTSFPAHPTSVVTRIGSVYKKTFTNPDVVNVIAANRYVATVCKETVPEISTKEDVYVAYPIYEGRVKLTNGLCIYNGKVYKVDWSFNHFHVSEEETTGAVTDTIYMNYGSLSTVKYSTLEYQTGHPVLACEQPGSIDIDGSFNINYMSYVQKFLGHFYLQLPFFSTSVTNHVSYDNLPGWTYTTSNPPEADEADYSSYFKSGTYKKRMVRDDDYIYIWNSTEIGYE
jgi:hypothetical protein